MIFKKRLPFLSGLFLITYILRKYSTHQNDRSISLPSRQSTSSMQARAPAKCDKNPTLALKKRKLCQVPAHQLPRLSKRPILIIDYLTLDIRTDLVPNARLNCQAKLLHRDWWQLAKNRKWKNFLPCVPVIAISESRLFPFPYANAK